MAESWLEHLVRDSGLFLEQRTGWFGFFHLSLLEYLAADRFFEEVENAPAALLERSGSGAWDEVCVLAVGSRDTDKTLLTDLVRLEMIGGDS